MTHSSPPEQVFDPLATSGLLRATQSGVVETIAPRLESRRDRQSYRPALKRDGGLDAVRGIAALVVVAYHSLLGFLPKQMAFFIGLPVDPGKALWTRFWFGLINGPAAVILFFVLSGFVLTRGCFATRRSGLLTRAAIKRYPRLAGPVLAVCLLAWLLFRLGLDRNAQASALTGSPWLAVFGNFPGPSLKDAFRQGLWRTLLSGDVSYNTSLWTMRLELIGSFVCLGAAAVLVRLLPVSRGLAAAAALAVCVMFRASPVLLSTFLAGVTLSVAITGARLPRLPLAIGLGLCAISLYFFGYKQPLGDFAWMASWRLDPTGEVALATVCSVVVIFAVEACPRLRAGLNVPVLRWLGQVSFALYLVHYLVIISAGSFVRVWLDGLGADVATVAAIATTFAVSLALATPLSWFDGWLINQLNLWVDRLVPRPTR